MGRNDLIPQFGVRRAWPARANLILVLSILIPFLYVLYYVWSTALEVPFRDDMYLIKGAVVEKYCNGTLAFADLWRAAARTRLLGYNLLLVANAAWLGLNSRFTALLIPWVLAATAILILKDFRASLADRCSPTLIAAAFALPMLLIFSIAQWEALGFGFAIIFVWSVPWFLASFYAVRGVLQSGSGASWLAAILTTALAILVFGQTAAFAFGAALAGTVVAHFALDRRRLPERFVYRVLALAGLIGMLAFLYLFRITENDYFPSAQRIDWSAFSYPWQALIFVFASLAGSVIGVGAAKGSLSLGFIAFVGLLVAGGYALALAVYFRTRMHERTQLPFFMIAYSFAFVGFMTVGRFRSDLAYGMASRYVCSTILGIIAVVWIAIFALTRPASVTRIQKAGLFALLVFVFGGLGWTTVEEWRIHPHRRNAAARLKATALNLENSRNRDLAAFEERPFLVRSSLRVLRQYRLNVYRNMPQLPPKDPPAATITLDLPEGAVRSVSASSEALELRTGYAIVEGEPGHGLFGTAVFRFDQGGGTATETAVPAVVPTARTRVLVEHQPVTPVWMGTPGSPASFVTTALAIVNPESAAARLTLQLRDRDGQVLSVGHARIPSAAHVARLIGQLASVAPDWKLPPQYTERWQIGSLEISSDRPVAVSALRLSTNARNEPLSVPLPVADKEYLLGDTPQCLPYFADGGGYTTSVLLLNTTDRDVSGVLQIRDGGGTALPVTDSAGTTDSIFPYSIRANGVYRWQSRGLSPAARIGWLQIVPGKGSPQPTGQGLLSFRRQGVLIAETGIPAALPATHARIFLDRLFGRETGLAVANPSLNAATITLTAIPEDVPIVGKHVFEASFAVPGYGRLTKLSSEFMPDLPAGFVGALDIVSTEPVAVSTARPLVADDDFVLTFSPVADMNARPPASLLFPQLADGGGYSTEFVLVNPGARTSAMIRFLGDTGTPLAVGIAAVSGRRGPGVNGLR